MSTSYVFISSASPRTARRYTQQLRMMRMAQVDMCLSYSLNGVMASQLVHDRNLDGFVLVHTNSFSKCRYYSLGALSDVTSTARQQSCQREQHELTRKVSVMHWSSVSVLLATRSCGTQSRRLPPGVCAKRRGNCAIHCSLLY
eukprot:5315177-Amphidinium_carterae.5